MVSTAEDLHQLFTAVLAGEVISPASVAEMIGGDDEYRLGVASPTARSSATMEPSPGYQSLVLHSPETGATAFFATNSDRLDFGWTVDPVIEAMAS